MIPKHKIVRGVWDNGGKSFDRYTVILRRAWVTSPGLSAAIGLSDNPDKPDGFSQCCDVVEGPHLGKPIAWKDLSENIQKHVVKRLEEET